MHQTEFMSASPETQQLLDLCVAIARGERNYVDVLRGKLAFRAQEMHQAQDHFFGQVDGEGEEFAAQFKAELDEVAHRFRGYEGALQAIDACLLAGAPPEPMRACAQALAEASHFLRIALGRYEQAEMSIGASKFPLINILDNLAWAVRSGKPASLWDATCAQYSEYYRKMLDEIGKSEHRAGPGVPEREKAVTWIVMLFAQLAQLSPTVPEDRVSALLEELTTAHLDLENSFNTYNTAILTQSPTRSPQVNLVLNTVTGFRAGKYSAEATRQVIQGYLDIVRKGMADLQPTLQAQNDSALLSESAASMLEAMEGVEDALVILLELPGNPNMDEARLQDALVRLRESGNKGAAATEDVRSFNETAGKVACIHCSTLNPMEARVCSNCARPMPLAKFGGQGTMEIREGGQRSGGAGPDFNQETIMTDVMKMLFDQCEAFEKGEIEAQTLLSTLDAREAEIRRAEEKLSEFRSPEIPEEAEGEEREVSQLFVNMADDALDMLSTALGQCQDGLDRIRQGIEAGNLDLMDEGRESYYEGCQKMWEVWKLDNALDNYLAEDDHTPIEASG